jgi:hypothetical protein
MFLAWQKLEVFELGLNGTDQCPALLCYFQYSAFGQPIACGAFTLCVHQLNLSFVLLPNGFSQSIACGAH